MSDHAPSIDDALHAGVALFNEGHRLAAHEPWETAWLTLDDGDDARFLQGLIQFAAATHHARTGNWSGAVGCAEGAAGYLAPLDATYRGLALGPVRRWCRRLATDPETIDRAAPPSLSLDGETLGFADLSLGAAALAAPVLAAAIGPGDEATLEAAAAFAREERGSGGTRFAELLFAYLTEPDARPQVAARLGDHVERKRRKRDDVSDLF